MFILVNVENFNQIKISDTSTMRSIRKSKWLLNPKEKYSLHMQWILNQCMHSYHVFVVFNRTFSLTESENFHGPSKQEFELNGTNILHVINMAVVKL